MKKLTRAEMKNLQGGNTEKNEDLGEQKMVKCCWVGTNNCSACNNEWSGSYCERGAELRAC